ncbi:ankyrin repeat domain-containing protein 50-like [Haliotis rubra]|uniref:ankyrin repeat domain-containing protein 50-like n=1 Tax=Haliotis rubra TaxID=36100 RepID=UPI001EE520D3|nr:ankyrin repeat domain-containing protein 50-like [Haliotis rubra]
MGANVSHVDDDGHSILHLASSGGCVEMVKDILSHNPVDINARDKYDENQNDPEKHNVDKQESFVNSPLHEACRKGDLKRVGHILSQGLVDINSRDEKHGRTPLMVAAQKGHCRIFDFLITKGADMSEVDNDCENILHWACKGGHVSMVECVLQQYGINITAGKTPPLILAAFRGNRNVCEFLVCMGANVSVHHLGYNVLHWACTAGRVGIVKYLLTLSSVDINSRGEDGMTPLMAAVEYEHRDVFELLVSMGANMSQVDDDGNSVLHFACRGGHLDLVKYLLSQSSVDINSWDRDGKTPLMKAVICRQRDVLELLVRMGANMSRVDDDGNNVLHFACRGGHLDLVKYLVSQNSVGINCRSKDGKTPLMEAALRGKRDVFDFLVSMGANVSHVDVNGNNILHLVSLRGPVEVVRHILSQNLVDINARDKDGKTAAMIAKPTRKVYRAMSELLWRGFVKIITDTYGLCEHSLVIIGKFSKDYNVSVEDRIVENIGACNCVAVSQHANSTLTSPRRRGG